MVEEGRGELRALGMGSVPAGRGDAAAANGAMRFALAGSLWKHWEARGSVRGDGSLLAHSLCV